ncbi:hypothetical protein H839_08798 [Parageobacillus genomosp. 1]|uniref:Uncharacterized protein n=1 Tax=Parageobacillus genomosp. 1 TaxID=1295642 RepID=A0ABC9VE81_9BACL|nr:hypothetical protein [Parageobacillus genomosp. 1]EZP76682.1 hypothetical protein H839_08798 [Parageobacillus genomosp. 1]
MKKQGKYYQMYPLQQEKKPITNKDELAALAGCAVYFKVRALLYFFLSWIKSDKPSLIFTINATFGHTVNDDANG